MENVMLDRPDFWQSHYQETINPVTWRAALAIPIEYVTTGRIKRSTVMEHLLKNLAAIPLPLPLISQYLPLQYNRLREGAIAATLMRWLSTIFRIFCVSIKPPCRRHRRVTLPTHHTQ
jgi:D-tagatose-1,6-bisphosphate aldolase subunit GatZ/KbaZ